MLVGDQEPTHEVMFRAGDEADSDRHKNMNGDILVHWVESSIIPTFRAFFSGEKIIIILDDAP